MSTSNIEEHRLEITVTYCVISLVSVKTLLQFGNTFDASTDSHSTIITLDQIGNIDCLRDESTHIINTDLNHLLIGITKFILPSMVMPGTTFSITHDHSLCARDLMTPLLRQFIFQPQTMITFSHQENV
jgi:hypothetical protein